MSQFRLVYRIEFRNPGRGTYPRWEQTERRFETVAEAEHFGMTVFSASTEWRIISFTPRRLRR
jgi:hypothetical protein